MNTHHFHELRLRLVDCARSLRHYRDNYETVKAIAEQDAIESGKAEGKNADERARKLTIALLSDSSHTGALALLRDAEYDHERVSALLEAAKDERRAAEWQIRAKLADGLFRADVQSDDRDPTSDSAFDDVADYLGTSAAYTSRVHGRTDPCYCDTCIAERIRADSEIPF